MLHALQALQYIRATLRPFLLQYLGLCCNTIFNRSIQSLRLPDLDSRPGRLGRCSLMPRFCDGLKSLQLIPPSGSEMFWRLLGYAASSPPDSGLQRGSQGTRETPERRPPADARGAGAWALLRLSKGVAAPPVAAIVPLTALVIRNLSRRCNRAD